MEITLPDLVVLAPHLVLFLGAMGLSLIPKNASVSLRFMVSAAILLLSITALVLNIVPSTHRISISTWESASFSLSFQLEGLTLILLLSIFVPLGALHMSPRARLDARAIWVLLAVTLFSTAANLITIYFAWASLDLALFAWRTSRQVPQEIALRGLLLGQLVALGFFAGTILTETAASELGHSLITLALWARLGLFPFHWISPSSDLRARDIIVARAAPLIAPAIIWLRWQEFGLPMPSDFLAVLAGSLFITAPIWIARASENTERVALNASFAVAMVPMSLAFGGEAGIALGLWIALGLSLALALFQLALGRQGDDEHIWARITFAAGLLSLAGLPLTPTFVGRVAVYTGMVVAGQGVLIVLAGVSSAIMLTSLWRIAFGLRGEHNLSTTGGEYLTLQLVGFAFVATTFAPMLMAQAIGQVTGDAAERALDLVIRTDNVVAAAWAWGALVLPIAVSFVRARTSAGYSASVDGFLGSLAQALELAWLARWIGQLARGTSRVLRGFSALAEENPTVWILLVGLWIAIYVLTTR